MSKRITIVCGHSQHDPGEKGLLPIGVHEYQYVIDLSYVILDEIHFRGYLAQVIFRDGLGIDKTYDELEKYNPDANIELHFNGSSNPNAYGTEVLCVEKNNLFANILQAQLCKYLGRVGKGDRGVKVVHEDERGYHSVSRLECANALIEPFFGTNSLDAALGANSKELIAKAIADSLDIYFGSESSISPS